MQTHYFNNKIAESIKFLSRNIHFYRQNKDLIWLPVLGLVGCTLVALYLIYSCHFGLSVIDIIESHNVEGMSSHAYYLMIVKSLIFYFFVSIITIYTNAALILTVTQRMQGKVCRLYQAVQGVASRWHLLFSWSLLSASMGLIFRCVGTQHDLLHDVVRFSLILLWSLTEYFVVPVMVFEKIGPFASFKRSTELLRQCLQENKSADITVGIVLVTLFELIYIFLKQMTLLNMQFAYRMVTVCAISAVMLITVGNILQSIVKSTLFLDIRKSLVSTS